MRVLLKFTHGLGDAVQLTIILKHLKKYAPHWLCDVWALHGKHTAARGLASRVYSDVGEQPRDAEYDQILNLAWFECHQSFEYVPSTKPSLCLQDVFHIEPDPELYGYEVYPTEEAYAAAEEYLRSITGMEAKDGRWPVVILHYQGNTSADMKNLPHDVALGVCDSLRKGGLIPVIFDWDRRSPIPDNRKVFCPDSAHPLWGGFGSGDAGIIAALIERSSLMIGIDSGPLHVAGATSTPTIGVWTKHMPIRYFDRADNVTHLVPSDWREHMRERQVKVFEQYYKFVERSAKTMAKDIVSLSASMLRKEFPMPVDDSLVHINGFWVRKDNIDQDMVIVNDVYANDCYKLNIIPTTIENAKVVVDVGAHIGVFAKAMHDRNPKARIICIEACRENMEALEANVGEFATVIHAACTYEKGDIAMLNSVRPNCTSTGGSRVIRAEQLEELAEDQYWPDTRPMPKVTLEALAEHYGFDAIDILKLDCEGSEYSILGNCDLTKVKFILGEYHGQDRWDQFRDQLFCEWDYGHMSMGNDLGNFHLHNLKASS